MPQAESWRALPGEVRWAVSWELGGAGTHVRWAIVGLRGGAVEVREPGREG